MTLLINRVTIASLCMLAGVLLGVVGWWIADRDSWLSGKFCLVAGFSLFGGGSFSLGHWFGSKS